MKTPSFIETDLIYQMDCIEGMKQMQKECVDVIVTSPPYNIGKPYATHNDTMPYEEYLGWMHRVAHEARRVLREDGSFFLNIGGKPREPWVPYDVMQEFREDYVLQNVIHWVKSVSIAKQDAGNYDAIRDDISVGHYQPVNSDRYLSQCHEHIFHFTPTGATKLDKLAIGVKYQDKTNIGRWKQATQDLRDRGNVWFIPYKTIRTSRPHPTSFPEKLPEMCIRLHGHTPDTIVCDPFMGIGNTALACITLGVHYIGFEIDAEYCDCAEERIRRRTIQEP